MKILVTAMMVLAIASFSVAQPLDNPVTAEPAPAVLQSSGDLLDAPMANVPQIGGPSVILITVPGEFEAWASSGANARMTAPAPVAGAVN